MSHEHSFLQWATFHYAPVYASEPVTYALGGDAHEAAREHATTMALEPPAHTGFTVLICPCGVYDVFPETNHAITTHAFQIVLRGMMLHCGYHPVGLVDEARELVAQGATHECGEWCTARHRCAVCDRPLHS